MTLFSGTTKPVSHSQVQGSHLMRPGRAADNTHLHRISGWSPMLRGGKACTSPQLLSKTWSRKCWPAGAGGGHARDFREPAPVATWQLLG